MGRCKKTGRSKLAWIKNHGGRHGWPTRTITKSLPGLLFKRRRSDDKNDHHAALIVCVGLDGTVVGWRTLASRPTLFPTASKHLRLESTRTWFDFLFCRTPSNISHAFEFVWCISAHFGAGFLLQMSGRCGS